MEEVLSVGQGVPQMESLIPLLPPKPEAIFTNFLKSTGPQASDVIEEVILLDETFLDRKLDWILNDKRPYLYEMVSMYLFDHKSIALNLCWWNFGGEGPFERAIFPHNHQNIPKTRISFWIEAISFT